MTANEAKKLVRKHQAIAKMPFIYKQIRELAKQGKEQLTLTAVSVSQEQMDILKAEGYKVSEEKDEGDGIDRVPQVVRYVVEW